MPKIHFHLRDSKNKKTHSFCEEVSKETMKSFKINEKLDSFSSDRLKVFFKTYNYETFKNYWCQAFYVEDNHYQDCKVGRKFKLRELIELEPDLLKGTDHSCKKSKLKLMLYCGHYICQECFEENDYSLENFECGCDSENSDVDENSENSDVDENSDVEINEESDNSDEE